MIMFFPLGLKNLRFKIFKDYKIFAHGLYKHTFGAWPCALGYAVTFDREVIPARMPIHSTQPRCNRRML